MSLVTCDDLARLIAPHPDRLAVLILLRDVEGKPNGEIQFVTFGKKAEDKVEAVRIREWLERKVFNGEVPEGVTHESFVLDAAKNKKRLDELLEENRQILASRAAMRSAVESLREFEAPNGESFASQYPELFTCLTFGAGKATADRLATLERLAAACDHDSDGLPGRVREAFEALDETPKEST